MGQLKENKGVLVSMIENTLDKMCVKKCGVFFLVVFFKSNDNFLISIILSVYSYQENCTWRRKTFNIIKSPIVLIYINY